LGKINTKTDIIDMMGVLQTDVQDHFWSEVYKEGEMKNNRGRAREKKNTRRGTHQKNSGNECKSVKLPTFSKNAGLRG